MKQAFRTKNAIFYILGFFLVVGCGQQSAKKENDVLKTNEEQVVNVYSHRHYDSDQTLFDQFTKETGIKVNVIKAKADELINRLELEGKNSPADLLITVDAGRLYRAKEKNLLQPVSSKIVMENVPSNFRDKENFWFGLTYRARILVYHKDKVKKDDLSTYQALTDERWKGQLLVRSSENIYNQSLLAAMISKSGKEMAATWVNGVVKNMARVPKGNDRDQVKAIAGGVGSVAIVNTYYIGKLLYSAEETEKEAGRKVNVFFPNQEEEGTHVNVSGAGVTAHAPNKENAVKLLAFLSGKEAQEVFAEANYEYPVNEEAQWSELLISWGTFKRDTLDLNLLGQYNKEAIMVFQQAGWN